MSVQVFILIQTEVGKASSVAAAVGAIAGVTLAEGVTGPYDVIMRAESLSMEDLGRSILAKVHRDRIMTELDLRYPGYGLSAHKGYVTRSHEAALQSMGVTEIHRRSYANIAALINS